MELVEKIAKIISIVVLFHRGNLPSSEHNSTCSNYYTSLWFHCSLSNTQLLLLFILL